MAVPAVRALPSPVTSARGVPTLTGSVGGTAALLWAVAVVALIVGAVLAVGGGAQYAQVAGVTAAGAVVGSVAIMRTGPSRARLAAAVAVCGTAVTYLPVWLVNAVDGTSAALAGAAAQPWAVWVPLSPLTSPHNVLAVAFDRPVTRVAVSVAEWALLASPAVWAYATSAERAGTRGAGAAGSVRTGDVAAATVGLGGVAGVLLFVASDGTAVSWAATVVGAAVPLMVAVLTSPRTRWWPLLTVAVSPAAAHAVVGAPVATVDVLVTLAALAAGLVPVTARWLSTASAWTLLAVVNALNVFDAAATWFGIEQGAVVEGNPLLPDYTSFLVKIGLVAVISLLLMRVRSTALRWPIAVLTVVAAYHLVGLTVIAGY